MAVHITITKQLPTFNLEVTLTCHPGELTAIIGPSGAGKSTLIRLIAGLDTPDSGSIAKGTTDWFKHGKRFSKPTRHRKVGLVFQGYPLFPHLSVRSNIAFAASKTSIVDQLLEEFNIAYLAKQKPCSISGGERQRTALCQALASEPQLLLLDEPFSALDMKSRKYIRERLIKIVRDRNIPVLHVTHDLEEAFYLADNIFIMENGKESQDWLPRQFAAGTKQVISKKELSEQNPPSAYSPSCLTPN